MSTYADICKTGVGVFTSTIFTSEFIRLVTWPNGEQRGWWRADPAPFQTPLSPLQPPFHPSAPSTTPLLLSAQCLAPHTLLFLHLSFLQRFLSCKTDSLLYMKCTVYSWQFLWVSYVLRREGLILAIVGEEGWGERWASMRTDDILLASRQRHKKWEEINTVCVLHILILTGSTL